MAVLQVHYEIFKFCFPPYVGEVISGLLNFIIGCCWCSSFLCYFIIEFLWTLFFFSLQLNADKSPFQRTFVNQVLFVALVRNHVTFWIINCIVWMGGFWKDRNREKRDQREIFNLSGLDTVQKRVEEDCAFYTYIITL